MWLAINEPRKINEMALKIDTVQICTHFKSIEGSLLSNLSRPITKLISYVQLIEKICSQTGAVSTAYRIGKHWGKYVWLLKLGWWRDAWCYLRTGMYGQAVPGFTFTPITQHTATIVNSWMDHFNCNFHTFLIVRTFEENQQNWLIQLYQSNSTIL